MKVERTEGLKGKFCIRIEAELLLQVVKSTRLNSEQSEGKLAFQPVS